jgi:hypothetical protein
MFQPPMCGEHNKQIIHIALYVWLDLIGLCYPNAPGANASLAEPAFCQFPSLVATCRLVPLLVLARLQGLLSNDGIPGSLPESSSPPVSTSTRFPSIS